MVWIRKGGDKMEKGEQLAIKLFGELLRDYHNVANKVLNKYGLYKGQPFILKCIKQYPSMTQKELAKKMGVTKSTIGKSIRRMEKMGFLKRTQDLKDCRCNRIRITEKGIEALENCQKDMNKIIEALYSKIPKEEKDLVIQILKKLLEGLNSLKKEENL